MEIEQLGNSHTSPWYHVYVLRFWREQAATPEHSAEWRFSLEDPNTRQRRGFANLDALRVFLEGAITESSPGIATCSKPSGTEKG